MSLVVSIALTHIRARMRQTLVGLMGVATGVGFSVMMAALMEGSQRDFVAQLVDAMPHISVTDQRREPPPQPAEEVFDLAQIHGLTTPVIRPGIKNPYAHHRLHRELGARRRRALGAIEGGACASRGATRRRASSASIRAASPTCRNSATQIVAGLARRSLQILERDHPRRRALRRRSARASAIPSRSSGGNGRTISANVVALFAHGHQPARREPGATRSSRPRRSSRARRAS